MTSSAYLYVNTMSTVEVSKAGFKKSCTFETPLAQSTSLTPTTFPNRCVPLSTAKPASPRLVFGIGILQTRENINQKNSLFACDYFFAYSSSRIRKIISSSLCTGQKEKKKKTTKTGNCTGFSSFLSFLPGLEKEDAHLNVCTKGHC